jgi:uncharacterized protein YprB with RNaseH-like and TPR domain
MKASRSQWKTKLRGKINFKERNLKMEREKQINGKKKRLYFTQFYHTKKT